MDRQHLLNVANLAEMAEIVTNGVERLNQKMLCYEDAARELQRNFPPNFRVEPQLEGDNHESITNSLEDAIRSLMIAIAQIDAVATQFDGLGQYTTRLAQAMGAAMGRIAAEDAL